MSNSTEVKVVTIFNKAMNFIVIAAWDDNKYTPGFIAGRGTMQRFVERMFDFNMKSTKADPNFRKEYEDLHINRHSYRRACGYRGRFPLATPRDIFNGFEHSEVTQLDKADLEIYVQSELARYKESNTECLGVFFNENEDLKSLYMVDEKGTMAYPTIKVINDTVDEFNILVIRDSVLNIMYAFPWKRNNRFDKEKLLTGDFIHFKHFLLGISQNNYGDLGKVKETLRKTWCEKRFFKMTVLDVEGLEIENIPVPGAVCFADTAELYLELLDNGAADKLLNAPNFASTNGTISKIQELLNSDKNLGMVAGRLMKTLIASRSWANLALDVDLDKETGFDKLEDTSYMRPANKDFNESDGRRKEFA